MLTSRSSGTYIDECRRTAQELAKQTFKNLGVICDASPKGKLDVSCQVLVFCAFGCRLIYPVEENSTMQAKVWLPLLTINETACLAALQKKADLLCSTASSDTKLDAAEQVADHYLASMAAAPGTQQQKPKQSLGFHNMFFSRLLYLVVCTIINYSTQNLRPKILAQIRQDKLASRDELRALGHVLNLQDLSLDNLIPSSPLRPIIPDKEQRSNAKQGGLLLPYIASKDSGAATWDWPSDEHQECVRLAISADEGSSMFCAFEYLCHLNACVTLHRDPLPLCCKPSSYF